MGGVDAASPSALPHPCVSCWPKARPWGPRVLPCVLALSFTGASTGMLPANAGGWGERGMAQDTLSLAVCPRSMLQQHLIPVYLTSRS